MNAVNTIPLRLALGLGCDRGTPMATLAQAVDEALAEITRQAGVSLEIVAAASIDLKADEVGLLELARVRGWPLCFHPAARLAVVPVPHPSETVRRHTGTPSVSEAAALLAAGTREPAAMSQLLVAKHRVRGLDGRSATVSIARIIP